MHKTLIALLSFLFLAVSATSFAADPPAIRPCLTPDSTFLAYGVSYIKPNIVEGEVMPSCTVLKLTTPICFWDKASGEDPMLITELQVVGKLPAGGVGGIFNKGKIFTVMAGRSYCYPVAMMLEN